MVPTLVKFSNFLCTCTVCHIIIQDDIVCRDDMNHLEYVGLCIKESLRLFPPVPVIGRELSQDVVFDGRVMPKGVS